MNYFVKLKKKKRKIIIIVDGKTKREGQEKRRQGRGLGNWLQGLLLLTRAGSIPRELRSQWVP